MLPGVTGQKGRWAIRASKPPNDLWKGRALALLLASLFLTFRTAGAQEVVQRSEIAQAGPVRPDRPRASPHPNGRQGHRRSRQEPRAAGRVRLLSPSRMVIEPRPLVFRLPDIFGHHQGLRGLQLLFDGPQSQPEHLRFRQDPGPGQDPEADLQRLSSPTSRPRSSRPSSPSSRITTASSRPSATGMSRTKRSGSTSSIATRPRHNSRSAWRRNTT